MRDIHMHAAVPDRWKVVRLGDVAHVRGGVGFPLERQGRLNGTYPFIKVSDMNLDGNEVYIRSANNYVDDQDISELGATIFPFGTIVFPKVGAAIATNKKRALVAPTVIDNNMMGVTVSDVDRCDGNFLYRWFELIDLSQLANVSAVPSITGSRLKREFVTLPPLSEQRAIAAVLDSIDEAIERTQAVIAAIESLRDALLHELLTRGVPGWHSEWKDAPGIGSIPACWEVVRLGEVYEVQLGKMLSPKARQGKNPRLYLTNRNVRWGDFDLSNLPKMDFDEGEIQKFQLRAGDLLVCEGGDAGRAAVWADDVTDCYYQKALHRLRPVGGNALSEFMLAVLLVYSAKGALLEHSEKTSILHLTRERLLRMRIPCPSRSEQEHIVAVLSSVTTRIRKAQTERDALTVLKTSAAAALLTGSLRVPLAVEAT